MYQKLKQAAFFVEEGAGFAGGRRRRLKRVIKKRIYKKQIRKHKGINPKTGKLKKGFRYTGKKTTTGLPVIEKIKIKTKNIGGTRLISF